MVTATPMLRQYQRIKSLHRDCILFFRLGDFYEMFYDDAREASRILDLVLTARGKGTPHEVPMCGIPFHAAEGYIARLVRAGRKVAICEQTEDPAAAQGIVKREVIRVITSGTYLDESTSDARFLLCLWLPPAPAQAGIAFMDPAAGAIQAAGCAGPRQAADLIARLPVCECVYPQGQEDAVRALFRHPLLSLKKIALSAHEDWCFNEEIARKTLCDHFAVHNLGGFGIDDAPGAVIGAGALLEYQRQMNKQPLRHIDRLSRYTDDECVFISPAAVAGLELDTLFRTVDRTLTAMGRRTLREWLGRPLKKVPAILQRQAAVTLLKNDPSASKGLKAALAHLPDIEKHVSRLSCGYTHPRDMLALRNALARVPDLRRVLEPLAVKNRLFALADIPELRELMEAAVNPDMPLSKPEGRVVRPGFDRELDELRGIQDNGREWLKDFQQREARRTGINSLKVGYNKVFGYYIEITRTNLKQVPDDYIRKQTLVNAERFITPELKTHEENILTAQDKILRLEDRILNDLRQAVLAQSLPLHDLAGAIGRIDALGALGVLAAQPGYVAPSVGDDTRLSIRGGRHPVVEQALAEDFVPNDAELDGEGDHLIILTGPNMAGKSTYIRQTALLVILAQAGSHIPAESAHIGVVDKIFTRIGAHDDIARGQSTFMVEMSETADILNNLSDRSLAILDEIGRGTSTFDGLSLAWALAEHLQKTKARVLFATHFHELTALALSRNGLGLALSRNGLGLALSQNDLGLALNQDGPGPAGERSGVKNYNVAVKEWKDEIVFLHKIVPGSSDDSYGIYVAKLAGIPKEVIDRSRKILTQLELSGNLKERLTSPAAENQMSFFAGGTNGEDAALLREIRKVIDAMDVNTLTPLDALNKIQELKERLDK